LNKAIADAQARNESADAIAKLCMDWEKKSRTLHFL